MPTAICLCVCRRPGSSCVPGLLYTCNGVQRKRNDGYQQGLQKNIVRNEQIADRKQAGQKSRPDQQQGRQHTAPVTPQPGHDGKERQPRRQPVGVDGSQVPELVTAQNLQDL